MKKIRCMECGAIIALEIEPIGENGAISIMCNSRKPNGKRCKTTNIITGTNPEKVGFIYEKLANETEHQLKQR